MNKSSLPKKSANKNANRAEGNAARAARIAYGVRPKRPEIPFFTEEQGDSDLSIAEFMDKYGFIVAPIFSSDEINTYKRHMIEDIRASPYLKDAETFINKISMSNFGACSLPDVFHCATAVALRSHILEFVKQHLKKFGGSEYVSVAHDRLMQRLVGDKCSGDMMFHRDIHPWASDKPKDDVKHLAEQIVAIMGGWLSLSGDNVMTLVPGTHKDETDGRVGCVEIEGDAFYPRLRKIRVPPGHLLLFHQRMAHVVPNSVTKDEEQWRMFTGVYFTKTPIIMDKSNVESVLSGAAPHLPSGQDAPMFDRFHTVFGKHRERLRAYSDLFVDNIPRDKNGFIPVVLGGFAKYGLRDIHRDSRETALNIVLPNKF